MNINNLEFFNKNGNNLNLTLDSDNVWRGNIYYPPLSISLFDNENLFILEKISGQYYFPQLSPTDTVTIRWSKKEDINFMFLYDVVLDKTNYLYYIQSTDRTVINYSPSFINLKYPMQVNIAFNPFEEKAYTRILRMYLNSTLIAELTLYGEGIEEDERFTTWINNFGIKFNREDALIIKDYDIKEAMPDWEKINTKRKELIVNKGEIFPYIGTYKGLMNIINILGYVDILHVKEYWKNVDPSSPYFNKFLLSDITEILNEGRIDDLNLVEFNKEVKFDKTFKKTGFLALAYEFTTLSDDYDEDGNPIVVSTTDFTFNEMFYKLNKLKDKLMLEFIPTNVVIKDIIGEFIYIVPYKFRYWDDRTDIRSIEVNEDIPIEVFPEGVLSMKDIRPLYKEGDPRGVNVPIWNFNKTTVSPYDNNQKYSPEIMDGLLTAFTDYYDYMRNNYGPDGTRIPEPWYFGDDFNKTKSGCPIILEFNMPEMKIEELVGVTAKDLTTVGSPDVYYYTFENIKYKNLYEIEWTISKSAPLPYTWTFRGLISDYSKIAHILPYHGTYTIRARVFDLLGGASLGYETSLVVVEEKAPSIVAIQKLEDKFDYTINNLGNVFFSDFGDIKWYENRLNVFDNSQLHNDIRKQILQFYFYKDRMYNISIKNNDGVYVNYGNSNHPLKVQWAMNNKRHFTFRDFQDTTIDQLYFLRTCDTYMKSAYIPGFTFKNPLPHDIIKFTSTNSSPQLGYPDYVIPDLSVVMIGDPLTDWDGSSLADYDGSILVDYLSASADLDALCYIMNLSNHPAVKKFSYSVINEDTIVAKSRFGSYTDLMFIEYIPHVGSPYVPNSITGDKYSFFEPTEVYSKELLDYFETQYPDFKREMMFLYAPFIDKANGSVNDPQYWEDNGYIKLLDGDVSGHLPSFFMEDYFATNKIKVHVDGFCAPQYGMVLFVLNNLSYINDIIWTLTTSDTKEEVISVKGTPFFIWRFDQLGTFDLQAVITDNFGNITTHTNSSVITVLDKLEYIPYIEDILTERFHNEINKVKIK